MRRMAPRISGRWDPLAYKPPLMLRGRPSSPAATGCPLEPSSNVHPAMPRDVSDNLQRTPIAMHYAC